MIDFLKLVLFELEVYIKSKSESYLLETLALYPDPGSNRDGLPHWCLRPARLPIPPSGLKCEGKGSESFYYEQKNVLFFAFRHKNESIF